MKSTKSEIQVFLLLYGDDMLVASKSRDQIQEVKKMLKAKFEIKQIVLGNGYNHKLS